MDIRLLAEQNPWWIDKEKIYDDEKVKEALSKVKKIEYSFKEFENRNLLIIGPRQVGKTTFLKLFVRYLIEKGVDPRCILYFSCEPIRDFEKVIEIIRFSDSLISCRKYILFDEITFVPEWYRAIKYILDTSIGKGKTIFVTGSSSIELRKEMFPGRDIRIKYFLPLSFKDFCNVFGSKMLKEEIKARISMLSMDEIVEKSRRLIFYFNEIERLFDLYLRSGGFPRSMYELIEDGKIREETYQIYWNWLISDIAKIGRSERITSAVLLGVLKNYGTRFSLNSIARETEIGSHVTVREYLEILENLFVLRNIFPMVKGQVAFRRMRKVYFIDPFLFHVFKKQLTQTRIKEEEIPGLVEGVVGEHLIRRFGRIFYYSQKKEVDFCTTNTGIEVKWQKRVDKRDFPNVGFKNKILLSMDQFEVAKDRLVIIPVSIFLLLL